LYIQEQDNDDSPVDLYILLDVFGQLRCFPSWIPIPEDLDYRDFSIPSGHRETIQAIPVFSMPEVDPTGPFYFYAAMFENGSLSVNS
jgi:hypothetical protein